MLVQGRYVVGADGANSVVRSWIGSEMIDLGYFHDWLVVDLVPHGTALCPRRRGSSATPPGPRPWCREAQVADVSSSCACRTRRGRS